MKSCGVETRRGDRERASRASLRKEGALGASGNQGETGEGRT